MLNIIKKHLATITWDKIIIFTAISYIIIPIIIFCFGWLKTSLAIAACLLFILFTAKLFSTVTEKEIKIICKDNCHYWFITCIISGLWVYLSGIGSFVFQNFDFWVRNPIYRDLSTYSWPVIYDLSNQSEFVQQITGTDTVAFSYYFTWWLPPAALSKALHFNNTSRNILLYIWAYIGILLVIYLLNRTLKRCSYLVPIMLIGFSGLDVIPYYLLNGKFPLTEHLETWATFFQYSSNTTQLFWVFNQSIPVWIIVALLLQLKNNKYIAGLCSLVFAYSPWATFGILPIAFAGSFRRSENWKKVFNLPNICIPIFMLIIFGAFYTASDASDGFIGLVFDLHSNQSKRVLCNYLLFIFIESGIFFSILGNEAKHNKYYWVVIFELILFPLFVVRDGNFIMRGTIPALFLLMFFIIQYLSIPHDSRLRTRLLVIVLCIGMITPLTEINRTLRTTLSSNDLLQEQVYTFGEMQTDDTGLISTAKEQFFIYDYNESIFFKYFAK